jgi:cbb3-type cytochrome oxidase cytochrome c subunit
MSKQPKSAPVAVKAFTFAEVIKEAQEKQMAEQAKFDAMTEDEQAAYLKDQAENQKEIDALVAELSKDPGFMAVRF